MKTALLVIDVQRGLFDDAPRPYEADTLPEIGSFGPRIEARLAEEVEFAAEGRH